METIEQTIPEETIEVVARSFFKETFRYGFNQTDYVKFINLLLDLTMKNGGSNGKTAPTPMNYDVTEKPVLPLIGENIRIQSYRDDADKSLLKKWALERSGKMFLISWITARSSSIDELVGRPNNYIGMIALPDQTPIGIVAFLDYDRTQHKAELRKLIGVPEYRGKGYAKEATRLWIRYGISTLGLRKIYLNTLDNNIRNVKLNEDLGFKVEGILRNECYLDGEYQDILRMGLICD